VVVEVEVEVVVDDEVDELLGGVSVTVVTGSEVDDGAAP
jgi:hypothetical protein